MRQFFKFVLASIAGVFIVIVIFGVLLFTIGISAASVAQSKMETPKNSILEIEIQNAIVDRAEDDPFVALLLGGADVSGTSVEKIRSVLKSAKADDNIKGVFLKLGLFEGGFASLQDIRQALMDFKTSGKYIYAHADFMDEKGFYLASAADSIFMNPAGDFFLKGFSSNITYFKGALDKIGVEMQAIRVGSYKSGVEPYTTSEMSPENREQIQVYINELYQIFLTESASGVGKTADQLRTLADNFTIQSVSDAKNEGLVHATLFIDEVKDQFKKRSKLSDEKIHFISYKKYSSDAADLGSSKNGTIAVIYATGEIGMGKGSNDFIGSEGISETLRKVRENKNIKAVVLRINSPGGSSLASDIIWREVKLTQAVKPVIVSMGNVAASGGYYIAAPADTIVAQASTITGSIGVFLLMPNAQELMEEKLGLKSHIIKTGTYSDFGDITRPLNTMETKILQGYADRVYNDFITKVAQGRGMVKDSVDAIARGRVWVATQAKQINLVDVLGNLDTAIAIAKFKANLSGKVMIQNFPKPMSAFEELFQMQTQVKTSMIKQELGPAYPVWNLLKLYSNTKLKGVNIQTRMPFDIWLN